MCGWPGCAIHACPCTRVILVAPAIAMDRWQMRISVVPDKAMISVVPAPAIVTAARLWQAGAGVQVEVAPTKYSWPVGRGSVRLPYGIAPLLSLT